MTTGAYPIVTMLYQGVYQGGLADDDGIVITCEHRHRSIKSASICAHSLTTEGVES